MDDDNSLIDRYLKGDVMSLEIIIKRYTPSVYNFSTRFVGTDNAKDVTQDVFIKVWKNIKNFDITKAHFKTWLFTIARNTTIDYMRKKKIILFSSLDNDEDNFIDTVKDESILQDEQIIKLEDKNYLNKLLDNLKSDYREVLILYYQEEMTFREIGEVLNKPLNTVKSYHYRALKELKDLINLHQNR